MSPYHYIKYLENELEFALEFLSRHDELNAEWIESRYRKQYDEFNETDDEVKE